MRHFGNVSANFWGTIELGGLGLRRVTVTSRPAYWSSWADCLGMVQQRHPAVSRCIVHALNAYHPAVHSAGVRASGAHLAAAGFVAPSWENLQTASGQSTLCWKWTGNKVFFVMVGNGQLLCQSMAGRLRTVSDNVYPFLSKLCFKKNRCQVSHSMAGRLRTVSDNVYPFLSKLCSDFKKNRCQVSHSLDSPPLRCLVSIPPPSKCCFFASRSCQCGRLLVVLGNNRAGCAEAGSWDVGGSLWRKRRHVCVARPAPGS